jgi:hypothetical protein
MVHAISILGNSVCSINAANWRKIFHALILPILTYGLPLYASQKHVVGLIKTLQVAQNNAIRKITGMFKTTPVDLLHFIAAIFPVKILLPKLLSKYADRVHCLPPTAQLHTLLTYNPVTIWPSWFPISTPITCLLAPSSPPPLFSFLVLRSCPTIFLLSHALLRLISYPILVLTDHCLLRPLHPYKPFYKA